MSKKMIVVCVYDFGDMVTRVYDEDKLPGMVTEIKLSANGSMMYGVSFSDTFLYLYEQEIKVFEGVLV